MSPETSIPHCGLETQKKSRVTADNKFADHRGFKRIAQWCRHNRHRPVAEQHKELCQKLQGHFAYYGITGNSLWVKKFEQGVRRIWQKWLHRRSRSSTDMPWDRFMCLMERYRFPPPRVVHSVYTAKP